MCSFRCTLGTSGRLQWLRVFNRWRGSKAVIRFSSSFREIDQNYLCWDWAQTDTCICTYFVILASLHFRLRWCSSSSRTLSLWRVVRGSCSGRAGQKESARSPRCGLSTFHLNFQPFPWWGYSLIICYVCADSLHFLLLNLHQISFQVFPFEYNADR